MSWIDDLRDESVDETIRPGFRDSLRAALVDEWSGPATTVDSSPHDSRRARVGWLLGAAAVTLAVIVGGIFVMGGGDESPDVIAPAIVPDTEAPDPAPSTAPPPVSVTESESSPTARTPTTVAASTSAGSPTMTSPLPAPARSLAEEALVLSTRSGLFLAEAGEDFGPTAVVSADVFDAQWFGDTVAYQLTDPESVAGFGLPAPDTSFIGVLDGVIDGRSTAERRYSRGDEWSVTLHDVGIVDGRVVMLVSASVAMPVGPDDDDVRLLLVDVETFAETDLGSWGGWEEPIRSALLARDGIVLSRSASTHSWVDVISHDGELLWNAPDALLPDGVESTFGAHELQLPPEDGGSLALDGQVAWVASSGFAGTTFDPILTVRTLDLDTGESETFEAPMEPDGFSIDAGFCHGVAVAADVVLCDRSGAPPISIDTATGVTRLVDVGDTLPGVDLDAARVRPASSGDVDTPDSGET